MRRRQPGWEESSRPGAMSSCGTVAGDCARGAVGSSVAMVNDVLRALRRFRTDSEVIR
jgi:hypothetical protein